MVASVDEMLMEYGTLAGHAQETLVADRIGELQRKNKLAEEVEADDDDESEPEVDYDDADAGEAPSRKAKQRKMSEDVMPRPGSYLMTARLSRMGWIFAPMTFGFSLLLVDVNALGSMIFGRKIICPIGHEWFTSAPSRKLADSMGKKAAIVEAAFLLGGNILLIFFLITVFGLLSMIVAFISSSWVDKIVGILNLGWTSVQFLVDTLKGII